MPMVQEKNKIHQALSGSKDAKPTFLRKVKGKLFPVCLRCLKTVIFFLLSAVVLVLSAQIILPRLIQLNRHRGEVINTLNWLTGRKVEIGQLELSLYQGLAIECNNFTIYEDNQKDVFAETQKAYFVLKLLPLLKKEIIIDKVVLQSPQFTLHRYKDGTFNLHSMISSIRQKTQSTISSQTNEPQKKLTSLFGNIEDLLFLIHEGSGHWVDERIEKGQKEELKINHVNLIIPRFTLNEKIPFRVSLEIPTQATPSYLELKGEVLDLPPDLNPRNIILDVQARMRSGNLDLLLPYYRRFLPYEKLEGRFTLKAQYLGNLFGDFKTHGSLLFQDINLLFPKIFKEPIRIDHGSLDYSLRLTPDRFELSRLQLVLDDAEITGNGTIENLRDSENGEVHFDFLIPTTSITTGQKFVPTARIPLDLPQFEEFFTRDMIGGYVKNAQAHLRGNYKDWNMAGFRAGKDLFSFQAEVDQILVELNPDVEPLHFTQGTVSLNRGIMNFVNIKADWADSKLNQGYGTITDIFSHHAFMKLWIDADLQWRHTAAILGYDLFKILPQIHQLQGSGFLESRVDLKIPLQNPKAFLIDGKITTSDVSIQGPQGQFHFHEISNVLTFTGNQWEFPPTNLVLGSSPITLSGSMTDYFNPVIVAKLESKDFNFDDVFSKDMVESFHKPVETPTPSLPPLSPIKGQPPETPMEDSGPGSIRNWRVQAEILLTQGTFRKFKFQNLASQANLQDGKLRFSANHFNAYEGFFQSPSFEINLRKENRGFFELHGTFLNFQAQDMYLDIQSEEKLWFFHGNTRLNGELRGNLLNKKRFLRELNGQILLEVNDGSLMQMKNLANAVRVMNLRIFSPTDESFLFDWARAHYRIKNGILRTDNLLIHGNLCSISAVGSADLYRKRIDGYIGIHLYEGMDKVLNAIPFLGAVVAGPDGKLVTTYFQISGPIEDPTIIPTPFHAITQGISRIFGKILNSYHWTQPK